jgi:hypothetical protein
MTWALQPAEKLYSRSVLCQGTTSVVPQLAEKMMGLSV